MIIYYFQQLTKPYSKDVFVRKINCAYSTFNYYTRYTIKDDNIVETSVHAHAFVCHLYCICVI